jgi:hypothetical protein
MVYMVDIGVLRSEVVGISSWGGVYYVQITISWQGGLRCVSVPVERCVVRNIMV